MIKLTDILFESILNSLFPEYKRGNVIVGFVLPDFEVVMSDKVDDHSELRKMYNIYDIGRGWRYNKKTKTLFFWDVDVPSEEVDEVKLRLDKKGFKTTSVDYINKYSKNTFDRANSLYHSHGGSSWEAIYDKPDRKSFYNPDEETIAEGPVEASEYKFGDVIVGIIDRDFNIIMSDKADDHRDLRNKFPGKINGYGYHWRYNKISQILFFWETDIPLEQRDEAISKLNSKGYKIKGIEFIDGYDSDSYEKKKALYHSHGGSSWNFQDPDRESFYNPDAEAIAEAPIDAYEPIGNFDKGGPFRDKRDRELIRNPVAITKVKDFFKNTSVDFDLYFLNLTGRRNFAERGKVDEKFVFEPYPKGLGLKPEQLKNGHINDNNITVFFVGNSAADKTPMTAWTIAHRFGHAIRREYAFEEMVKWLESQFEELLRVYGKNKHYNTYGSDDYKKMATYGKSKANLFNQVGTMRSARLGKINRPFEFYYELFAQYLKDGKVSLNKLSNSIKVGTGPYGRKETAYTQRVEDVNDILSGIERDFGYYAEDVLGSCVGNIYVM